MLTFIKGHQFNGISTRYFEGERGSLLLAEWHISLYSILLGRNKAPYLSLALALQKTGPLGITVFTLIECGKSWYSRTSLKIESGSI